MTKPTMTKDEVIEGLRALGDDFINPVNKKRVNAAISYLEQSGEVIQEKSTFQYCKCKEPVYPIIGVVEQKCNRCCLPIGKSLQPTEAELVKLIQDNIKFEVTAMGTPVFKVSELARALMRGGYGQVSEEKFCECIMPKYQYYPNVPNFCMGCGKKIIKPAEKLPVLPGELEPFGKIFTDCKDEPTTAHEYTIYKLRDAINALITWAHDIERRVGK